MSIKECYACPAEAASKEHAPPKCLFPIEYRNNLITVPSCNLHNSEKSQDDQFLMLVLSMNLDVNDIALKHTLPKAIKSYLKKPQLVQQVMKNFYKGVVDGLPTAAFQVDRNRVDRIFDNIARAIYYTHFNQKLISLLEINPLSIIHQTNLVFNKNVQISSAINKMDAELSKNLNRYGKNQEIFYYQMVVENSFLLLVRMVFYQRFIVHAKLITRLEITAN